MRPRTKKLSIEEMKRLAKSRSGKCLSTKYTNNLTKLKWQCKKGHVWEAMPINVKNNNQWCPVCAGNKKLNISDMRMLAKSKEGKCLSKTYINARTKLKWQCKEGHTWEAIPYSINKGTWCSICNHFKKYGCYKFTIEQMQQLALDKGGKCLSKEYSNKKLMWKCKEGHIWRATPGHIRRGQWCPICGGTKKLDIDEMKKLAENKGGKCLSTKYTNGHIKLKWQCKEGHIWKANPNNIKYNSRWCPICSTNISERICRKFFEKIFNAKFLKRKPGWLISPKGNKMELDGYCEKLGLAFEYHGEQHYKHNHFFHKLRDLNQQIKYDKLKRKLCKQNNVILIEIPFNITYEKMKDYIIAKCKKKKIRVPKITSTISHELFDVYSPERLKEMKNLAESRDGKCLSTKYIPNHTKLKWRCKEGHTWEAIPSSIKKGLWCPVCGGTKKLNIKDMKRLAKSRGGKCLSTKYTDNKTKLKWQCKEGHTWKARPTNVKNKGRWCPTCANITGGLSRRLSIEEMRELAKRKDGKCLSTKYIYNKTKLKWKCNKGHTWEAVPSHIKRNHWCPFCAGVAKLSIKEMRNLAKSRDGKCLSTKYVNNKTKLEWQCKDRHIWKATPKEIKGGTWCPICVRKK